MPHLYYEDRECPVLCLTKVFLFVVTTLFVLYLPLGDPKVVCHGNATDPLQINVAPVCNMYEGLLSLGESTIHLFDILTTAAVTALYEGKIKIYSMLSKYDRDDYCKVGACSIDGGDETSNPKKKRSLCQCKPKYSKTKL